MTTSHALYPTQIPTQPTTTYVTQDTSRYKGRPALRVSDRRCQTRSLPRRMYTNNQADCLDFDDDVFEEQQPKQVPGKAQSRPPLRKPQSPGAVECTNRPHSLPPRAPAICVGPYASFVTAAKCKTSQSRQDSTGGGEAHDDDDGSAEESNRRDSAGSEELLFGNCMPESPPRHAQWEQVDRLGVRENEERGSHQTPARSPSPSKMIKSQCSTLMRHIFYKRKSEGESAPLKDDEGKLAVNGSCLGSPTATSISRSRSMPPRLVKPRAFGESKVLVERHRDLKLFVKSAILLRRYAGGVPGRRISWAKRC